MIHLTIKKPRSIERGFFRFRLCLGGILDVPAHIFPPMFDFLVSPDP